MSAYAATAVTDIRRKTSAEAKGQTGDSPPIDEGRPRQEAPSPRTSTAAPILRRRRAAALRCEPLHDGQRDPWRFTRSISPGHLDASRAAWAHLAWLGLVDSEGFVEGVLRDLGRAS